MAIPGFRPEIGSGERDEMGRLGDATVSARRAGHETLLQTRSVAILKLSAVSFACLFLANCTVGPFARVVDPKYGVAASPRVVEEGQLVPRGGGYYRLGNAYTIAGRVYTPEHDPNYRAEGLASWYGRDFHGRRTANGEIFDMESISAAHPTLPIPSYARVTNLTNRKSVIVRVNDRGPFKGDRLIDVSVRTADLLGFRSNGLARVRVEYIGPASLEGSDDRKLMATLRHDGQPAPAPSAVMVASGGPFVPSAPAALPSRSAVVPSPVDRPFELGRYSAGTAAPLPAASQTLVASTAPATRASFSEPHGAAAPRLVPASTAMPMMATGRGLY
jgi:rare lipoprotein A